MNGTMHIIHSWPLIRLLVLSLVPVFASASLEAEEEDVPEEIILRSRDAVLSVELSFEETKKTHFFAETAHIINPIHATASRHVIRIFLDSRSANGAMAVPLFKEEKCVKPPSGGESRIM